MAIFSIAESDICSKLDFNSSIIFPSFLKKRTGSSGFDAFQLAKTALKFDKTIQNQISIRQPVAAMQALFLEILLFFEKSYGIAASHLYNM